MKQLFLLLLLANAVFFLMETYVRPSLEAVPVEADAGAKLDNIVLVSELPPVPEVQASEPLSTLATARPRMAATQQAPSLLAPLAPAPILAQEPATTPPANAKPETAPQAPTATDKPALVQCRRIGPLTSEADAQALRQRLGSGAGTISVEHQSDEAEIGYWVLYLPAATLDAARANQRMLMEKGAKDAALLIEGEYARGVSLGYFKERGRAEKVQVDARAKGMNVLVKPRVERRDAYWLKLQSPATVDTQWQVWREEHPGTPARDINCP